MQKKIDKIQCTFELLAFLPLKRTFFHWLYSNGDAKIVSKIFLHY